MRDSTKLQVQYWGILLLYYGGCTLGGVFVVRRILVSLASGEITTGRHGGTLLHLASEPVRYWLVMGLHALVAILFFGMVCYFARKMEHGPWRRRRR
jgi:ABC-type multidrug transport system permease subunit